MQTNAKCRSGSGSLDLRLPKASIHRISHHTAATLLTYAQYLGYLADCSLGQLGGNCSVAVLRYEPVRYHF